MSAKIASKVLELGQGSNAYNLTPRIIKLLDRGLLNEPKHPLCTIKSLIHNAIGSSFTEHSKFSPIVSVAQNFDWLNIPLDHVSRLPSNSYYINNEYLLRTHTSAHQIELLSSGSNSFIVFGDVYRRDEIDKYHYPVFHQMEAVKIIGNKQEATLQDAIHSLKETIENIVEKLFGKCEKRWIDAYFPFTEPSFELEIYYQNSWMEVLGCGIIDQKVMERANRGSQIGWAAGLGLERLAMKLFKIPDVRLFWSEDDRFKNQFTEGQITEFKIFSKYPACLKDFSMWITDNFNENDLFEVIRDVAGDLVEEVKIIDSFTDPKSMKKSCTFRVHFRSLSKTLTNEEIVELQFAIRKAIDSQLPHVSLR